MNGFVFLVLMILAASGGRDAAELDTEALLKEMTDKLDEALQRKTGPVKIPPETQEALEEYGIELDIPDNNYESARKVKKEIEKPKPSLDGEPSEWPGHSKPFGSVGDLAHEIEVIEGEIKPSTFINRYATKQLPVIVKGIIAKSPGIHAWDATYFGNAPPSAMSEITAYDSSESTLPNSTMSFREFTRSDNSNLFLFEDIPSFLWKDLVFPRMFKCDSMLKSLKGHLLAYYKRTIVTEPVATSSDRLVCPVRGRSSYVLVPAASWESSVRDELTIHYSAVDYNTHPWLRELEYHRAVDLAPGDCLYVPQGWYVQSSHNELPSLSVVFSWNPLSARVSKATCGAHDLKTDEHLGGYTQYFPDSRQQRDSAKDALIHYFLFYLGEELASGFTLKQFIRKIKRDDKLLTRLVEWTEDTQDIAAELFELLDVNADGRFKLDDVLSLPDEARDVLVAQIQDRLQDFGAIMTDQQKVLQNKQAEKKKLNTTPETKAKPAARSNKKSDNGDYGGDDLAREFNEKMQEEMDRMFKELEAEEKARQAAEGRNSRAGEEPKTREQIKKDAKEKAAKRKSKERKNEEAKRKAASQEKFLSVDDEEIEILAEEEDENNVKQANKRSNSSMKQESKSANQESNKKQENKPVTNVEKDNKPRTNSKRVNQQEKVRQAEVNNNVKSDSKQAKKLETEHDIKNDRDEL